MGGFHSREGVPALEPRSPFSEAGPLTGPAAALRQGASSCSLEMKSKMMADDECRWTFGRARAGRKWRRGVGAVSGGSSCRDLSDDATPNAVSVSVRALSSFSCYFRFRALRAPRASAHFFELTF